MVNESQVMDELTVAAPGRTARSAPKALTDDVIAISYVAEVPTRDIRKRPCETKRLKLCRVVQLCHVKRSVRVLLQA